jgi:prevent-host-death family protein
MHHMSEVTIRDLRNRGGQVVDRVSRGERITITRDGRPVAELRPFAQSKVTADVLLARWRHLPVIDLADWRNDIDELLDSRI